MSGVWWGVCRACRAYGFGFLGFVGFSGIIAFRVCRVCKVWDWSIGSGLRDSGFAFVCSIFI